MKQAFETLGYLWPLLLVGLIIIGIMVIADQLWQQRHSEDDDDMAWQPAPKHRRDIEEER